MKHRCSTVHEYSQRSLGKETKRRDPLESTPSDLCPVLHNRVGVSSQMGELPTRGRGDYGVLKIASHTSG